MASQEWREAAPLREMQIPLLGQKEIAMPLRSQLAASDNVSYSLDADRLFFVHEESRIFQVLCKVPDEPLFDFYADEPFFARPQFVTNLRFFAARPKAEVKLPSPATKALPLEWILEPRKLRTLANDVLAALVQLEAHEPNLHFRDDYREMFIAISLGLKGDPAPLTSASYRMFGVHPDKVYSSILARRKAQLGTEYEQWWDENGNLRADTGVTSQGNSRSVPDECRFNSGSAANNPAGNRKADICGGVEGHAYVRPTELAIVADSQSWRRGVSVGGSRVEQTPPSQTETSRISSSGPQIDISQVTKEETPHGESGRSDSAGMQSAQGDGSAGIRQDSDRSNRGNPDAPSDQEGRIGNSERGRSGVRGSLAGPAQLPIVAFPAQLEKKPNESIRRIVEEKSA